MFEDLQMVVQEAAAEEIDRAESFSPEALGLDRRAACRVWRGEDFLAIRGSDHRTMMYYGGFEYVAGEYVLDLGNYVFFSTEDSRVRGHWDHSEVETDD